MNIKLHDKIFEPYLDNTTIANRITEISAAITEKYADQKPIFLVVLNGAFIFAADLLKQLNFDCEIYFIKLSSYDGMNTTGDIKTVIGLTEDIENRTVIIIEDIIDTGNTLYHLLPELENLHPKVLTICTLLQKTAALTVDLKAEFIGFEIPNRFVVGYGLDYNNLGRNYSMIYQLKI
jgi:hypoxanthine phosphoribosyltransferase